MSIQTIVQWKHRYSDESGVYFCRNWQEARRFADAVFEDDEHMSIWIDGTVYRTGIERSTSAALAGRLGARLAVAFAFASVFIAAVAAVFL